MLRTLLAKYSFLDYFQQKEAAWSRLRWNLLGGMGRLLARASLYHSGQSSNLYFWPLNKPFSTCFLLSLLMPRLGQYISIMTTIASYHLQTSLQRQVWIVSPSLWTYCPFSPSSIPFSLFSLPSSPSFYWFLAVYYSYLHNYILAMQLQSTTSQSIANEALPSMELAPPPNRYLINTAKAVRGHKLKTNDFIKMQLMRFRKCSPAETEEPTETSQPIVKHTTEFRRFKPFESIEEVDVQRFVTTQKILSRENKGLVKMFNNTKINSMVENPCANSTQLTAKSKPVTEHHNRQQNKKFYSNSKTIANEHNIINEQLKQERRRCPKFRSENLGHRMNNYLNKFLYSEGEPTPEGREEAEPDQTMTHFLVEDRHSQTIDFGMGLKKSNVSFVRRMKKKHRSRAEDTRYEFGSDHKSEQLQKPQTALLPSKRSSFMVGFNKDR